MSYLIKNGTIVTEKKIFKSDILIKNNKIIDIQKSIHTNSKTDIIDASDKYIFPGGIDGHTHFELPVFGSQSKDDFDNGTKAAACGGVTTIIDFVTQAPGESLKEAIEKRKVIADPKVNIDYSLHCGITDWNNNTRKEFGNIIKKYGITSFKCFMIYKDDGRMSDDGDIFDILEMTNKYRALLGCHCENIFLIDRFKRKYYSKPLIEKYSAFLHTLTRPDIVEYEAVNRLALMTEYTEGFSYVVHISAGRSSNIINDFQKRGTYIIGETCPQYLLLTQDKFKENNGHYYATCPQLKTKNDNKVLWQNINQGGIDIIGTDTCTFDSKQKNQWNGDYTKIPYGMPGVETMVPLMFSEGVIKKRISLQRFVQLVSTNPAKLFGLYPKKGTIKIGSDADIIIYDKDIRRKIDCNNMQTNCDWNPFQGMKLNGYPEIVMSNGNIVAKTGKWVGKQKQGKFLQRRHISKKLLKEIINNKL